MEKYEEEYMEKSQDIELLRDIIYEKEMECPLCKAVIKKKCVKGSKNRLIRTDYDLCSHYEKVNPLFYEVIVCNACGFAQINKRKEMPTAAETELICRQVSMKFSGRNYSEFYTAEEAIDRYKLALLNAIVRNASEGEKAYIALKIGWIYRELRDEEKEVYFLEQARNGLIEAYHKEGDSIFELNEEMICYLVAALSYRIGDYKRVYKWIDNILKNKKLEPKLKSRCFELMEMTRNMAKQKEVVTCYNKNEQEKINSKIGERV